MSDLEGAPVNSQEWERMAKIAKDGEDSSRGPNILSHMAPTLQGTKGRWIVEYLQTI